MKSIQSLLFMAVLAMGLNVAHVLAEEAQQSTAQIASIESQIKELDQKIASVQAQIDALKKKGIVNLSDDEFVTYDELTDQLLAAMRAKIAQINTKITELELKIAKAKKNIDTLSDEEFDILISTQKELKILSDERDTIRDKVNKQLDQQLDIEKEKGKALDEIKKLLTKPQK